ncbi:MAG: hypothetical protein ACI3T9_02325 [Romboutsia timonensis]
MKKLEEVMTFSEASEYLEKSPQYLNDMMNAGYLLEGLHFRSAGRVKLVLKEVVDKIKDGTFKKETDDIRIFYSKGYNLGTSISESNKQFVRSLLLTLDFKSENSINELIKLFVANECEFPHELVSDEYKGDKVYGIQAIIMGINNGLCN